MPRLGGYQKKRKYVQDNNPAFFKVNSQRQQADVIAEYHRLQEVVATLRAEAIALEEKARLAEEKAVAKEAAKLKKLSLEKSQEFAQTTPDFTFDGTDRSNGTTFEQACSGDFNNGAGSDVYGAAQAEWKENIPPSSDNFGEAFIESNAADSQDWATTETEKTDQFTPNPTMTVTDPWGATEATEATEAWGEEQHDADPDLPDDGLGQWSTVPKRKKNDTHSKPKDAKPQNTNGCFNCGGDHKKADCPEPPKPKGECHKCHEEGHFSRDCPNKGNEGGRSGACRRCGEEGHFAAECPNGGGSGGGRACFKCGSTDHLARECPNGDAGGSSDRTCFKCGEPGHMSRECPTGGGGASTTDRVCYNCHQPGHMSRDCPQPRQENSRRPAGRGACYKCGQEGHQARSCPNEGGEGFGDFGGQSGFGSGSGFDSSNQKTAFDDGGFGAASEWQSGGDELGSTEQGDGGDTGGMW